MLPLLSIVVFVYSCLAGLSRRTQLKGGKVASAGLCDKLPPGPCTGFNLQLCLTECAERIESSSAARKGPPTAPKPLKGQSQMMKDMHAKLAETMQKAAKEDNGQPAGEDSQKKPKTLKAKSEREDMRAKLARIMQGATKENNGQLARGPQGKESEVLGEVEQPEVPGADLGVPRKSMLTHLSRARAPKRRPPTRTRVRGSTGLQGPPQHTAATTEVTKDVPSTEAPTTAATTEVTMDAPITEATPEFLVEAEEPEVLGSDPIAVKKTPAPSSGNLDVEMEAPSGAMDETTTEAERPETEPETTSSKAKGRQMGRFHVVQTHVGFKLDETAEAENPLVQTPALSGATDEAERPPVQQLQPPVPSGLTDEKTAEADAENPLVQKPAPETEPETTSSEPLTEAETTTTTSAAAAGEPTVAKADGQSLQDEKDAAVGQRLGFNIMITAVTVLLALF